MRTPTRERFKAVFPETPEGVSAAALAYLAARDAWRQALGKNTPHNVIDRLSDTYWEAGKECERVILEAQGGSFKAGFYRVGNSLVGMQKINKGGLELVVTHDTGRVQIKEVSR